MIPDCLTWRELDWMTEGKQSADWARTSELLALTANCHRNPEKKKQEYLPREFNLWERRFEPRKPKRPKLASAPITVLKCFLKG